MIYMIYDIPSYIVLVAVVVGVIVEPVHLFAISFHGYIKVIYKFCIPMPLNFTFIDIPNIYDSQIQIPVGELFSFFFTYQMLDTTIDIKSHF